MDNETIISRSYLGFGKSVVTNFEEVDGFTICMVPSKYDDYEYLYIIKDNRKIIKVSQFYHRNYEDVKKAISKKVKFIGKERFSYRQELKEIFI